MVMEIAVPRRLTTARPGLAATETLKLLPTRRPADPPAPSSALQWSLIDPDRYEVTVGGETTGFIDVVGAVYVVLEGLRYDIAVEIAQTLVFERALQTIGSNAPAVNAGRP